MIHKKGGRKIKTVIELSFDEIICKYDSEYDKLANNPHLTECEFVRKCNSLRQEYLLKALELAENEEYCRIILKRLSGENISIKQKIKVKFPAIKIK